MTNRNFIRGTGRLATDRFDFASHTDGYGFRHTADQIDLSPSPLNIFGNATNVEQALQNVATYISFAANNGVGFIAVGDGYDCYHNSDTTPNTPFDSTTPSLDIILNDLLNNTSNSQHHRIRDGGIVLIKAGTYIINSTVNIPPGIILMGEGYGTKLVNQVVSGSYMFSIQADTARVADSAVIDNNIAVDTLFTCAKDVAFFNMVISDNFVEPRFLGDTGYLTPINTNTAVPLINLNPSSGTVFDRVKFLGRVSYLGFAPNTSSGSAIGISGIPAPNTSLFIKDCQFDGFAVPITFDGYGTSTDYFYCHRNRIRCYGSSSNNFGEASLAVPIAMNVCNADISDNFLFTNFVNGGLLSGSPVIVSVLNGPGAPSFEHPKANIVIANNNVLSTNASGVAPTSIRMIEWETNPGQSAITAGTNCLVYGNSDISGTFNANQAPNNISSAGIFLGGPISYGGSAINTLSSGISYTIGVSDTVLLLNRANTNFAVSLPAANAGQRLLTIKEVSGNYAGSLLTIQRNGADHIEGVAANYTIGGSHFVLRLVSDGVSNWWVI
jgi:hypothetical protein